MGYPFHTPLARSAPLFPRPLREEQDRMKYDFRTYIYRHMFAPISYSHEKYTRSDTQVYTVYI